MSNIEKFNNFLESLITPSNASLIESIKAGYALVENDDLRMVEFDDDQAEANAMLADERRLADERANKRVLSADELRKGSAEITEKLTRLRESKLN